MRRRLEQVAVAALAAVLALVCSSGDELTGRPCDPSGSCLAGHRCRAGTCVRCVPEACDGEDNDCNGLVDDGLLAAGRRDDLGTYPIVIGVAPGPGELGVSAAFAEDGGVRTSFLRLGDDGGVITSVPLVAPSVIAATPSGYALASAGDALVLDRFTPAGGATHVTLGPKPPFSQVHALVAHGDELVLVVAEDSAPGQRFLFEGISAADELRGELARIPGTFGARPGSLRIAVRSDGDLLLLWIACVLEDGGTACLGSSRAQAGRLTDGGLEGPLAVLPEATPSEVALDVVALGTGGIAFVTDLSGEETRVIAVPLDASARPSGEPVVVWQGAGEVTAIAAEPLGSAAILLVEVASAVRCDVVRVEGPAPRAHAPIPLANTAVVSQRGWLAAEGATAFRVAGREAGGRLVRRRIGCD